MRVTMLSRIKTLFIYLLVFSSVFFIFSCKVKDDPNLIQKTRFDNLRIPDKYNTGTYAGTVFNTCTETETNLNNVYIRRRMDTSNYVISSYGNNLQNLPAESVIENYDFSDMNFVIQNSDRYGSNKKITFNNCKFKSFRNDTSSKLQSKIYCVFNHCEFSGPVNSAYITLNDCKIGGFTSDAMNPVSNFKANRLYVYDLLHEGNQKGSHLDGIQIFGDSRSRNNSYKDYWITQVETGNIHLNNVRFEIPSINFDGNTSYVNASIMFQLEFSDVNDVSFENVFINGGGKWFPIYLDHGKNNEKSIYGSWQHKNLVLKNAWVSDNFGKIFYPNLLEDATIKNVDHYSYVYITSAWKDEAGKVHIIASNDTRTDAVITVKSNKGTSTFEIPHCPSNWALGGEIDLKTNKDEALIDKNGKPYSTYRWNDLPFDKEYIIPGNPDFIVCYQGEERLSYWSFDEKNHYYTEIKE